LRIVITSDTIATRDYYEGKEEEEGRHGLGADNLSASNLARGRFVYRLSDDTFRRYRSHPIPNDFPPRAAHFYGRREGRRGREPARSEARVFSRADETSGEMSASY